MCRVRRKKNSPLSIHEMSVAYGNSDDEWEIDDTLLDTVKASKFDPVVCSNSAVECISPAKPRPSQGTNQQYSRVSLRELGAHPSKSSGLPYRQVSMRSK